MHPVDIYTLVTQQIIAAIEAGAAAGSYRMPWHNWGANVARPTNIASGRAYRGINILLLWAAAETGGYSSGRWATYRQWREAGAQVRKGEQATPIIFWKALNGAASCTDHEDVEPGSSPSRMMARTYCVFNQAQVDGAAPPPQLLEALDPSHNAVAQFIAATGMQIRHGGDQACYMPRIDQIWLPEAAQFRDCPSYYAVLSHEAIHWTGAKHRLDRQFGERFGDEAYAFEELIAELGAAFIAAQFGLSLEPRPDHAAYIASWLKVLKHDPKAILTAAAKAQQAVDFLSRFSQDAAAEPEPYPALTRTRTAYRPYINVPA